MSFCFMFQSLKGIIGDFNGLDLKPLVYGVFKVRLRQPCSLRLNIAQKTTLLKIIFKTDRLKVPFYKGF